jgi:transcriptional regulator with XRE-family HTH domain
MNISTAAPVRTPHQFGRLIAAAREAQEFSQAELADRLRVHRPSLSHLENGQATIQMQLAFDVLHELGLDMMISERLSS